VSPVETKPLEHIPKPVSRDDSNPANFPGTTTIDPSYTFIEGGTANFNAAFQQSAWTRFDVNFTNNIDKMANMSPSDIDLLRNAITSAEVEQTGVDLRFIIAIIMQESHGDIRVASTPGGDGNNDNGPMQAEESASANGMGDVSQELVTSMILAGTNHFLGNLQQRGGNVFEAFRLYNSGFVNSDDLNDGGKDATDNYVNDVANRLHGFKN